MDQWIIFGYSKISRRLKFISFSNILILKQVKAVIIMFYICYICMQD